jgi:hypothetical protein
MTLDKARALNACQAQIMSALLTVAFAVNQANTPV